MTTLESPVPGMTLGTFLRGLFTEWLRFLGLIGADYQYETVIVNSANQQRTWVIHRRLNMDVCGPDRVWETLITPELTGNPDLVPYWSKYHNDEDWNARLNTRFNASDCSACFPAGAD